jgi:hypothetical protein
MVKAAIWSNWRLPVEGVAVAISVGRVVQQTS